MTGPLHQGQEQVYRWLRACLIGPAGPADRELLADNKPLDRYLTGILFPVLADEYGLDAELDDAEEGAEIEDTDTFDQGLQAASTYGTSQPRRRFVPPASVGFSFYIEGNEIQLQVIPRAVRYQPANEPTQAGRSDLWQPVALGHDDTEALNFAPPPSRHRQQERRPVFTKSAEVMVLWRPLASGWLVTVSLSNTQQDPGRGDDPSRAASRNALTLFRVELECFIEAGRVGDYPRVDASLLDEEELELELQYRAHRIYAIGHGAAVDWELTEGRVRCLRTEFLPRVEVPQVSAEGEPADGQVLCIDWLAGIDTDPAPRLDELTRFANRYQDWIARSEEREDSGTCPPGRMGGANWHELARQPIVNESLFCELNAKFKATDPVGQGSTSGRDSPGHPRSRAGEEKKATDPLGPWTIQEQATVRRILDRMHEALRRLREGIDLLSRDPEARLAFALANRAMANQMRQSMRVADAEPREPAWRPFQLAFILLALPSALDPDHPDRETVDLIWFPTGGGKTEAYLGLLACVICWRRLKYPTSGGGTAALMRYTLRLLTKDQFRRAARLVCALELLRRDEPALGAEPISLGLWVGGASSPNTFGEAQQAIDQALGRADADTEVALPSALVLEHCPWCGTPLRLPGNVDAGSGHFRFLCTAPACAFGTAPRANPGASPGAHPATLPGGHPGTSSGAHPGSLPSTHPGTSPGTHPGATFAGSLPCNVVDTALYERPPTLLLATLDKFARLAWEERAGAFLGGPDRRPPELIIQDEFHLIAGALGSVAGLYEAAVETLLVARGVYPKIIASTATIRQARAQVRRLFGRNPAIFPPPGLDSEDSYFARTVPLSERPGRLYVGYLAPARDRQHSLAPVAAALLAAPEILFGATPAADREALLDAWWTLLVYHSSLKGVGISRNAVQDIETLMARLHQEALDQHLANAGALFDQDPDQDPGADPTPTLDRRSRLAEHITQLTSQMSADENAQAFARLRRPRTDPEALDLALATNMVSVGLDVARLAVMVINGQPLTTAEYIQASSRVGRGEVPGLVVANYYRDQARSLSHYESFRAYHESFYRFVEPTSLTPFTWQARRRALHAALVIAVRHGCPDLAANEYAGAFDPDRPEIARLIQELARRCRRADPSRGDDTAGHLAELARQWADQAAAARAQRQRLVYAGSDGDRRDLRLLCGHDDRVPGLWQTLHSMRNVENTALVGVQ